MILRCDPEDPSIPTPIPEAARPDRILADQGAQADSSSLPLSINPWAILDRLPLADAVLNLSGLRPRPRRPRRIFQAHRGPSFEQVLAFPTFVQLIADALLQHQGSGRQSFQRAEEQGRLPTSVEAAYGKLRRDPHVAEPGLPRGDLRPPPCALPRDRRRLGGRPLPARAEPVILDGKKIKKVAKRLKATRAALGKLSGGKLWSRWRRGPAWS